MQLPDEAQVAEQFFARRAGFSYDRVCQWVATHFPNIVAKGLFGRLQLLRRSKNAPSMANFADLADL